MNQSYPTEPAVDKGELPDLFSLPHGSRISSKKDWPARSRDWRDLVLDMEYGGIPPKPTAIRIETLSHSNARTFPGLPRFWSYRIHCEGGEKPLSFTAQILIPNRPEPVPVIIYGDGCWRYMTDEVMREIVESGCALVMFNRTELAEDLGYDGALDITKREGGLYDAYPGQTFGALSAWAWGYHRCVDLVYELPFIDKTRIAISGHSRGGKTTLVAGATDERITLVNDNASGAGGGGAYRYVGNDGETLEMVYGYPSWFGPGLRPYFGREGDIPFDQHCLLASIAPRPLLLTYALDDRHSNPEGMVQCAWAVNEVYRYLGLQENLAFHLRPGQHFQAAADWKVLLDFIACKWQGKSPKASYNTHPYQHLRPAFSWKAPL